MCGFRQEDVPDIFLSLYRQVPVSDGWSRIQDIIMHLIITLHHISSATFADFSHELLCLGKFASYVLRDLAWNQ